MKIAEIQARHDDWDKIILGHTVNDEGFQAHADRAWLLSDRTRLETEIRLLREIARVVEHNQRHNWGDPDDAYYDAVAALAEFDKVKS